MRGCVLLCAHIDQNHHATSKVMNFDIWAQIPPQDAKGFQTSHQTHLKVIEWNFMFFRQGGPKGTKNFHVVPLSKKHKISVYNFQLCLMSRLKALGILRWNLGSDIKLHDIWSSAMVLIDVNQWFLAQFWLKTWDCFGFWGYFRGLKGPKIKKIRLYLFLELKKVFITKVGFFSILAREPTT